MKCIRNYAYTLTAIHVHLPNQHKSEKNSILNEQKTRYFTSLF